MWEGGGQVEDRAPPASETAHVMCVCHTTTRCSTRGDRAERRDCGVASRAICVPFDTDFCRSFFQQKSIECASCDVGDVGELWRRDVEERQPEASRASWRRRRLAPFLTLGAYAALVGRWPLPTFAPHRSQP